MTPQGLKERERQHVSSSSQLYRGREREHDTYPVDARGLYHEDLWPVLCECADDDAGAEGPHVRVQCVGLHEPGHALGQDLLAGELRREAEGMSKDARTQCARGHGHKERNDARRRRGDEHEMCAHTAHVDTGTKTNGDDYECSHTPTQAQRRRSKRQRRQTAKVRTYTAYVGTDT